MWNVHRRTSRTQPSADWRKAPTEAIDSRSAAELPIGVASAELPPLRRICACDRCSKTKVAFSKDDDLVSSSSFGMTECFFCPIYWYGESVGVWECGSVGVICPSGVSCNSMTMHPSQHEPTEGLVDRVKFKIKDVVADTQLVSRPVFVILLRRLAAACSISPAPRERIVRIKKIVAGVHYKCGVTAIILHVFKRKTTQSRGGGRSTFFTKKM